MENEKSASKHNRAAAPPKMIAENRHAASRAFAAGVFAVLFVAACETGKELVVEAHDGVSFVIRFDGHTYSIKIGDSLGKVEGFFGPADYSDETNRDYFDLGLDFNAGYVFNLERSGRISSMSICGTCDSADYEIRASTDKGVGIGDSRSRVHEIYGAPDKDDSSFDRDTYRAYGLRFDYADDGRIHHIYVIWPCESSEVRCLKDGVPVCLDDSLDCSTMTYCNGSWEACERGATPYCGEEQGFNCCPADHPTFCDVAGPNGACWTPEVDCSTIMSCDGEWRACYSGDAPQCGANVGFNCCPPDYPTFCDVAGPDGACWTAGTDCSTITECEGEWHACRTGKVFNCESATCE